MTLINLQLAMSFDVSIDQGCLAVQINNYANSSKILSINFFKNVRLAMTFDISVDQVPCAVYQQCSIVKYPVNRFFLSFNTI